MRNYEPRNIVINTITAAGAGIFVSNQIVWIEKNRVGRFLDLVAGETVKETAITSATAGVVTYTPTTPLNDTDYSIQLTQLIPAATGVNPKQITKVLTIHTPATGTITATTISNQFKNEYFSGQITTYSSGVYLLSTSALGTGSVVMTAAATAPVLFASWYAGGGVAGDVVNTTSGIQTRGLPANMLALGVPSASITDTSYTLYSFGNNENTGQNNTMKVNQHEAVYVWIASNATNFAGAITRMDELINSFPSGGSTFSDPEIDALA